MEKGWKKIAGGITAPQGFRAAAIAAGLKPSGGLDMTLIVSESDATLAGLFTTNRVKAACITYNQQILSKRRSVRAILINAGQANACTGQQGEEDNAAVAGYVAEALHVDPSQVLTASTGVIGQRLKVENMAEGIPTLVGQLSADAGDLAARAILTTDLVPKAVALESEIEGHTIRLGGIAKGSGMIHPNMATMLAFYTCDAAVQPDLWQEMVRRAVDISFNQITVDGDTSTNDMVLALTNGRSGLPEIRPDTPAALILEDMLHYAFVHLAKAVARDGEGATKLLDIRVRGAERAEDARQIARTIASSPLVKSAAFGCDPNWGRVLAAAGRSGVPFDLSRFDVLLGDFVLMRAGTPQAFDRKAASEYLKGDPVVFTVDLHQGMGEGIAWGCDLSYDYVRINAEYTT